MQYLLISKTDTLTTISKIVGSHNIDALLAENGLSRTPKIGQAWYEKVQIVINTSSEVTASRKSAILNTLTGSEEIFEKACLLDEDEWKVLSNLQAFPDALRIPESISLPYSSKVIGDSSSYTAEISTLGTVQAAGRTSSTASSDTTQSVTVSDPVSTVAYQKVMKGLKSSPTIDQSVFNTVNTSPGVTLNSKTKATSKTTSYSYNLPWGNIQMYSTLLKELMDFPAYPENLSTSRKATYTSMPDIIYQYEPWIVYQNSGPREQRFNFHFHRDMWTGNHLDGNANNLIRFCEANTFPDYEGSSVLTPLVRLYIDGSLFITGVITTTTVEWSGPLGLDNWYLDFNLSLVIQEISDMALDINTVRKMDLKGV